MISPRSDLTNKTNGAATDFKNKTQSEGHQLDQMAQNAGDRVGSMAQNAGDRIGSMASNFANSTAESVKSGREYVKENPVQGIAIAAVAGAVVGSLFTVAMRGRRD